MNRFARIIETAETQVLFYVEYDDEIDSTRLNQITNIDGLQVNVAAEWNGPDQLEKAMDALEAASVERAQKIVDYVRTVVDASG